MKSAFHLALLSAFAFTLSACNDSKTSEAPAAEAVATSAATARKCEPLLVVTDQIDTPAAKISVTAFETADTASQSYIRASFMLQDYRQRLTEDQVRSTLDQLYKRITSSCRKNPIQRAIVFLYPTGAVAGNSSAWIARLQTSSHEPQVDIRHVLLKDDRTNRLSCLAGKEPGKDLGLGTRLPPQNSRVVIGTWADPDSGLTMSFERVGGKVYQVYRSAYCSSNDRGEPVRQTSPKRFAVIDSRAGDYFEIETSGDLGVYDRQGRIDIMPAHLNLFPAAQPNRQGT
jgi:hypothetical protein